MGALVAALVAALAAPSRGSLHALAASIGHAWMLLSAALDPLRLHLRLLDDPLLHLSAALQTADHRRQPAFGPFPASASSALLGSLGRCTWIAELVAEDVPPLQSTDAVDAC